MIVKITEAFYIPEDTPEEEVLKFIRDFSKTCQELRLSMKDNEVLDWCWITTYSVEHSCEAAKG